MTTDPLKPAAPQPANVTGKGPLHLTRMALNPRHPHVRRDLRDASGLHRTLMSLLPDGLGDTARQTAAALHRTDIDGTRVVVLLQSAPNPDVDRLPGGYLTEPAATKDIAVVLATLTEGMALRYRILVNPTHAVAQPRAADGTPVRGKRTAVPAAELPDWWQRQATRAGLHFNPLATTYSSHPTIRANRPNGKAAIHAAVRIDGIATITDPHLLRAAVREGVGRGKAHGLGLLSLATANR